MKSKLVILATIMFSFYQAQTISDTVKNSSKWTKKGNFTFLLNQSSFSNWASGGENSLGGNATVNYDANYKDEVWSWDNKFLLAYGTSKIGSDSRWRKTNDQLELNSVAGRKAWGKYWYYSFFGNFKTQFTDGFLYTKDANDQYRIAGLFAPAYLSFGPGLLWKKHDNLKVNIAPATSKITFLSGEVFTYDDATSQFISNKNITTYGVDAGKKSRYELGFYLAGYYKFNIMENVSMENLLNLYTNYLKNPQNVDLDYTMNLNMKVNKYVSANATVQLLYDDDAYRGLQSRQIFGAGLSFGF